uniref:Uncharacterized protein n=1 Tax=Oryza glaberrima TaxID=4538 RepID=I1NSE4_ORYGL
MLLTDICFSGHLWMLILFVSHWYIFQDSSFYNNLSFKFYFIQIGKPSIFQIDRGGGDIEKICTSSFFVQLKWCLMTAHKNLTLALCQALLLLSNLHINIVPSFGDMGALGIDLCRRSRLRWPHGDGLHASGLADGRDVQPPCWPHAVVLLRHRPRERLHHAAVGVAHSPWASSPPAPDLATGGPDLPHTTPAACSRVRRAPLGLLRAPSRRANLC